VPAADRYVADMHEHFRRLVFNILIDNTDDHEKNHALLVTDAQQYELAPAYDALPSGQALGFQQMRVGELEADSTIANALSMANLFDLSDKQAVAQVRRVAVVVTGWQQHFASRGVAQRDLALLAEQIDRPFLADQRREYQ
jgi:serine/threonine-protein kinase HipA